MRLSLNPNEPIEAYTFENRKLKILCNQSEEKDCVIDILPRVRYLLNLESALEIPAYTPSTPFFRNGLIMLPHITSQNPRNIRQICVLNLSERNVRLRQGQHLFDMPPNLYQPPRIPMEEENLSNESF